MVPQAIDAEIVSRAKTGDHQALSEIYELYAAPIYNYILHRVHEVDLAEEIQADVFLRMVEGMHRYEDRGWPISAWLYRIARDRLIDVMRRRKLFKQIPFQAWEGACDGPEQDLVIQLDAEQLWAMLGELTNEQRQVISLRFQHDLTLQEVAAQMGCSEGAVKSLQHRGLATLTRRFNSPHATL